MIRRRIFNVAAAISLLLLLATVSVWIRSRVAFDVVTFTVGDGGYALAAAQGRWLITKTFADPGSPRWINLEPDAEVERLGPVEAIPVVFNTLFARYAQDPAGIPAPVWWAFSSPLWLLTLLTAVLPVSRVILRRPKPRGLACSACNYNLTGNTSGVCPECGTAIKSEPGCIA